MTEKGKADTRERLLRAAADLVAASPGQDVPLRAICEAAGVKLPTLYHFFGSKEGLLDAVVQHGFDVYLGVKEERESTGDPIADLRAGWDAHVEFGLANPGFYALMYGQASPGSRPAAQDRATRLLLELMRAAERQQRLVVDAEQATAHVLAANVGVTLRQIILDRPDPSLSRAMREATVAAITGTTTTEGPDHGAVTAAHALLAELPATTPAFEPEELALLRAWLVRLGRA